MYSSFKKIQNHRHHYSFWYFENDGIVIL
jgi:hypothetical protein